MSDNYENVTASRALVMAGWDDVPHLDAEAKSDLLAETPPWLREARSEGKPSLGAGAIYPIPEKNIKIAPFMIPAHWPRAYAMDVGWNWTVALWGAWDQETLTWYIFGEYYGQQELPQVHAEAIKGRGKWIPGCIDPAANISNQKSGEKLKEEYIELELNLINAENAVEAGLHACWMDLSVGRIKIFSTLVNFFSEYRLYRRDEHGKIVKKKDHLMDCMRYLRMTGASIRIVKPLSVSMPGNSGYADRGVGGY